MLLCSKNSWGQNINPRYYTVSVDMSGEFLHLERCTGIARRYRLKPTMLEGGLETKIFALEIPTQPVGDRTSTARPIFPGT